MGHEVFALAFALPTWGWYNSNGYFCPATAHSAKQSAAIQRHKHAYAKRYCGAVGTFWLLWGFSTHRAIVELLGNILFIAIYYRNTNEW